MLTARRGFAHAKALKNMYVEAFPKAERLPFFFLFLFCLFRANLTRYYLKNDLCAFTVTVKTRDAAFLIFFAVKKECRGTGIGTSVLDYLKNLYPDKTLVADVEDPVSESDNADQRRRRVAFYEKNGLLLTEKALDEYCGRLRLVSSAPLSEKTVAALCARASFLRWTYRPAKDPAPSDEERIAATAKAILEKYKKAFEELAK